MKKRIITLAMFVLLWGSVVAAAEKPAKAITTPWGTIAADQNDTGVLSLHLSTWPKSGKLELPTPSPNITRAYLQDDRTRRQLSLQFNADATHIDLLLPTKQPTKNRVVILETAEKTLQYADGRIAFSALDAQVHGNRAKLETHPGNHRIGFWADAEDYVDWNYTATRPGMYEVELTYSLSDGEGTEIAVEYAGKLLKGKLVSTGSWYKYTAMSLGKLYVAKSGKQTLTVKCLKKTGAAVMNLKAITLRPTVEGKPIHQAKDGTITCHARDVTIHGVKVQYEPRPIKNTVGYWVNEKDWIHWEFTADRAGTYAVEILQGCGKGHGGSEVSLAVDGQPLRFIVEDTGHFQNFKPRTIGKVVLKTPGRHTITVKPIHKAKVAVMDLRQVRLIPTEK